MSKKWTAALFALTLFVGTLTLVAMDSSAASTTAAVPAVEVAAAAFPLDADWSISTQLSSCTYSQCMRHCQREDDPPVPWLE
ncbi:MAG: hypothetical protein AAFY88_06320, partial [Acidobacteriota bacterium]